MKHCLYLFLRMAVRQFYGRRGLRLGLYRWTTSRGLLGIRRMDRVPNAQIRELRGVTKGVDKRMMKVFMMGLLREPIYESVLSRSVGRPWKRWIDTVKDCLRKRGLDIKQARRVAQ